MKKVINKMVRIAIVSIAMASFTQTSQAMFKRKTFKPVVSQVRTEIKNLCDKLVNKKYEECKEAIGNIKEKLYQLSTKDSLAEIIVINALENLLISKVKELSGSISNFKGFEKLINSFYSLLGDIEVAFKLDINNKPACYCYEEVLEILNRYSSQAGGFDISVQLTKNVGKLLKTTKKIEAKKLAITEYQNNFKTLREKEEKFLNQVDNVIETKELELINADTAYNSIDSMFKQLQQQCNNQKDQAKDNSGLFDDINFDE